MNCAPVRRLLAAGPACQVEECSCGVLHVTIGVLTVRLDREVVLSLWRTLGDAVTALGTRPFPACAHAARGPERPS